MHHAIRTRHDERGQEYSNRFAISFVDTTSVARQEFKDEADINIMLKRFGVNHQQRTLTFGEQDYTIDLQAALSAIDQSKRVYARMAPEVKEIYPTWQKFVSGLNSGALAKDLERIEKAKAPVVPDTPLNTEQKPNSNT